MYNSFSVVKIVRFVQFQKYWFLMVDFEAVITFAKHFLVFRNIGHKINLVSRLEQNTLKD
ncbi:MAG: hypothetical protein DRR19_08405 [Candidatus Parabeggiatoa sp. nov. 1]|nr:MAG: hypothetical protein DRR19_08405 [Gammaproteobacteria bacterium]